MEHEPSGNQGEERRRRIKKKRRVTRFTVGGKEVNQDILKNPSSLEFPDPGRHLRKLLVVIIILAFLGLSALLFLKVSDVMPADVESPDAMK